MRLRCDSTHAGHACSHLLDFLGLHPGDHAAHERHDLSRPVLATWPNAGTPSRGIPVASPSTPGYGTGSAGNGRARTPGDAPAAARRPAPRVDPYAYEITEWDLLPDA